MRRLVLLIPLFTPLSAIICYVGGVANYCEGTYCAISHQPLNGATYTFQLCGNMGLGQTGNDLCPAKEYDPYNPEDYMVTCCNTDYCNKVDAVPTLPPDSASVGTFATAFLLYASLVLIQLL